MLGKNKQSEIQPQPPDKFDDRADDIAFQPFFEHMLNGVAYCHMQYEDCQPSDFIYLYTNPAFEKLTGLKNVTGKLVSEVIPGIWQSNPELFETYSSVAAGGAPVKFETYIEALGIWFSLSVYSPKQDHFVAMFDVITECKLAEKQLKHSEETYRTMFETVTHGIVYQDNEGHIISANPAAERILGLSIDQMQGLTSIDPIWGAIHEDGTAFPGDTHPTMLAIKTGKPVYDVVMGINNPMVEHTIWIKINAIPIFKTATEEVDYAYSTFENITERKKAEAELAKNRQQLVQNEEQLRYVLQGSELGFWDWNIVTKEVHRNARWAEMLGYTYSELKNTTRQWTDFIHPDDRDKAWQSIVDVLEGKSPAHKLEYRMLHKDGSIRWILDQANVIQRSSDGKPTRMSGTHTDTTARHTADDEIKQLAFYDPLTGLSNRRFLMDRLTQHLAHARRSGDLVAVCMLDLDGFKQVNDQLGHEAGDALLIEVAKRLQESVRLTDTVSRFGGDEFSLILTDIKKINECEQSFNRIIASLGTPYQVNGHIARVTASIGATIFPNDGDTPDLLLRHADQAMYEAKEAGKNCYCLFNPSQLKQQMSNKATLDRIGNALSDGQFTLFYQPQVDCRLGQVVGVEALIRWRHPILGILAPSEFIPLLEHDNLIIKVGEWVIHEALRQQVEWSKAGFDLNVSVNVASRQLHQELFVSHLIAILKEHHPDTIKNLTIEIVETTALEDISRVSETIKQCRDLGVKFAIDDFGTGFSSLAHLKHLPVNELKIDKSFVFSMLHKPEDLAIVRGVIGLGKSFKHIVVAEGVESIDQILMLMDLGCNIVQGYLIARPMPAEQLTSWLKEFEPHPLWKLPLSQAPSRDYFELLLAETNHRHWINGQVEMHSDRPQDFNPQQFVDYKQCRFGHWLYGDGNRQFGRESWFLAIQTIHQQIHDSALKLFEYQHDEDQVNATAEVIYLQEQQNLLNDSLKNARKLLSDQYLMANLKISR